MNFIDKMVEQFMKVNRRMKRWQRVVSVLAAIVVFVTTYSLVLPAITLDKETASTQAGIEVAASENEAEGDGTVFEAEPEEEPAVEEQVAEGPAEEPAEGSAAEESAEAPAEDSGSESGSADAAPAESEKSEEPAAEENAGGSEADDAEKTLTTDEAANYATTEEAIAAVTGQTAEEVKLITEQTQLTYKAKDYTVFADFGESAKLPEGVELQVKEITKESDPEAYEMYYEKALSEMQDKYDENTSLSFAKFYDIAFVYEGVEIEPSGNVSVRIEYKKAVEIEESTSVDTIHFDKNNDEKPEVIDSDTEGTKKEVEAVEFKSDQFSVYGVVGAELKTDVTLPGSDDTYEVTVTYGPEANIPDGATLSVTTFTPDSQEYKDAKDTVVAAKKAADENFDEKDLGFAALDISIKDAQGNKIEPAANAEVKVSFQMKKLPETATEEALSETLEIQHLNEATEAVETVAGVQDVTVAEGKAEAEFTITSFSTFTLTWGDNSATIHYGYLDTATDKFVDFEEDKVATLDTTVASVNLANTFDGYSYIGTTYKAPSSTDEYDMTSSILTRVDNGWQITHKTSHEEDAETVTENIANGSDIYVYYGEPRSNPQTPVGGEIPTPVTDKSVEVNDDGTATVTLDITGTKITETDSVGANVLLVLDTTFSMSSSMTGATNRFEAARSAALTLIDTLDCGTNDIDLALVEFNALGSIKYNWTKDYTTFRNYMANTAQHVSGPSGTNWESGLYYAQQVLNRKDSDATYVIFLTDGEPNRRGETTSTSASAARAISAALDNAQAITALSSTSLYGVFCGDATGYDNLYDMIDDAGGVETINGTDAQGIKDAFEGIAHTIVSNLGASGVSVDDGVTNLSSVSATVSGTAGGYKYYYKEENSNTWTEWTAENGAPGATYSEDNGVTWDLSTVGSLPAGTTYRVQFTVWPSQEALDLIANLNNGTVDYDSLDEKVKKQISGDKVSGYTLATNTHLNTTYSFKGNTYTDPKTPLPNGEMPLSSHTMNVTKVWNDTINTRNRANEVEFYLLVDGKYYQKDGTTSSSTTGNEYMLYTRASEIMSIEGETGTAWYDSVFIAPGFIKDGEVLESGHAYELAEKAAHKWKLNDAKTAYIYDGGNKIDEYTSYSMEFESMVVRPMIIDGTLTYLVKAGTYDSSISVDTSKSYTIEGDTYYTLVLGSGEDTATIVGSNNKTPELDITKVIDEEHSLTDMTSDQFDSETFDYTVTFVFPAGSDPSGVGYWLYEPADSSTGWTLPEYDNATQYQPDHYENGAYYHGSSATSIWGEGETIDTSSAVTKSTTVTLTRSDIIRFTNLPVGTQYTIVESAANGAGLSSEGYAVSGINSTNGTVNTSTATVTGTASNTDTRYYNQFTNVINAVDVNIAGSKHLEGYDWSGESYHFTLATTGSNPMPPVATGKTEFDLTAASGNADQSDIFGRLRFTAAGTYTYTISETNAGTLQVVNGKAVQFGDAVTVTIEIEENSSTNELSVKSVTGTGVTWDANSKTVTASITNTAPTTTVNARKAWLNADETTTAPIGAKVTFTLYQDGTKASPAQTVELDGTADENGETAEWTATFSDLQKYKVVDGEAVEIVYTIFEEDSGKWRGYDRVNTEPVANNGTITNQQSTLWVQFKKTDMSGDVEGHRLAGAVFAFNDGTSDITLTSGNDGVLANGDTSKFELPIREQAYAMTETTAPNGYNKLTDVVNVTVATTGVSAKLGDTTTQYTVTGTGTQDDPYVVVITNSAGKELPNAGGPGTILYTLSGLMLILASAMMYGFRMRRGERRIK